MKCTSSLVKSKVDKTHAILNYKTNNLFVYSKMKIYLNIYICKTEMSLISTACLTEQENANIL